ncbi:MAG: glycosyltransferase [Deltaproteobacteria bacterium]|nr:glycosyltransferase [Deltaproteobacteria bacterium]
MSDKNKNFSVFVDLTSCPSPRLKADFDALRLACATADAFVVTAPISLAQAGATFIVGDSPTEGLIHAMNLAGSRRQDLLVLLAALMPADVHVRALQRVLEADPMFGFAVPRLLDESAELVWALPHPEYPEQKLLSPRALAALPERWIAPEFTAPCILIKEALLANPLPEIPADFTACAPLLQYVLQAYRRKGFRAVVANRVIVRTSLPQDEIYPKFQEADLERLKPGLPAAEMATSTYAGLPAHKVEHLCAAAFPLDKPRSIIIDCRAILPVFNGTTKAGLGLMEGFSQLETDLELHFLLQDVALEAHHIYERFPNLTIHTQPFGEHAAYLYMRQPWGIGALHDIHSHGFFTACYILDTIAWDILYVHGGGAAPPDLEETYNIIARYLDGIMTNSQYSLDRFKERFSPQPALKGCVTLHSTAPYENMPCSATAGAETGYMLVFGNAYDHKDVLPTTYRLHEMFPERRIIAFGAKGIPLPQVEYLESGELPEETVEELIAGADVFVFPSWYEGFGMPVVNALACGKPVVIRDSALCREIAGYCALPGVLLPFDDVPSLQAAARAALARTFSAALSQGAALDENKTPVSWKTCARRVLDFVTESLEDMDAGRCLDREKILRAIRLTAR